MPRDASLHLKLDAETDENLKRMASAQGKSKGQLVREAISACYQTSSEDLPLRHRQALEAYQGGFISLGKLARAFGIHVLEMRRWLSARGIDQRNAYGEEDAAHA